MSMDSRHSLYSVATEEEIEDFSHSFDVDEDESEPETTAIQYDSNGCFKHTTPAYHKPVERDNSDSRDDGHSAPAFVVT